MVATLPSYNNSLSGPALVLRQGKELDLKVVDLAKDPAVQDPQQGPLPKIQILTKY